MAEFFGALSSDVALILTPFIAILNWLVPFGEVADAASELLGLVA